MTYQSPLQVDNPMAPYRVHCPTCRQNIWAGLDEPPAQGDDIIAAHDCPGPADVAAESGLEPESMREAGTRTPTTPATVADGVTATADQAATTRGRPVHPVVPLAPPQHTVMPEHHG